MLVGRPLGGQLPGDGAVQDDQDHQRQPEKQAGLQKVVAVFYLLSQIAFSMTVTYKSRTKIT